MLLHLTSKNTPISTTIGTMGLDLFNKMTIYYKLKILSSCISLLFCCDFVYFSNLSSKKTEIVF